MSVYWIVHQNKLRFLPSKSFSKTNLVNLSSNLNFKRLNHMVVRFETYVVEI